MTRTGKIARLPRGIREQLNIRLEDGEKGRRLVNWLNAHPKVREVLRAQFGKRPINEQNLTEWKQGGFVDWQKHQEAREWVREIADESVELEEEAGGGSVADRLSASIGVALGRCLRAVSENAVNDPKQRRALLDLVQELTQLRRGDHVGQQLQIERERWEAEKTETMRKKKSEETLRPLYAMLLARQFTDYYKDIIKQSGGVIPPELQAFLAEAEQKTGKKYGFESPPTSTGTPNDQTKSK